MKTIILKRIELSGFKSFATPCAIDFDATSGMVLIAGDNQAEPRLGANGAGKSTIVDALCFCLYGTSVRGSRIGDLVTRGQKKTEVTITLDEDGDEVGITRSGPPARIYVSGEGQVEQEYVDRLIGLTRRQFLNSVVYGQAMPLFIDLPIPERGDMLDEVLDLELWMRASARASGRAGEVTAQLNRLGVEVGRTEGAISALEPVEAIQEREASWEADRTSRVSATAQEARTVRQSLRALREPTEQELIWADEQSKRLDELSATLDEKRETLRALDDAAPLAQLSDLAPLREAVRSARVEMDGLIAARSKNEQELHGVLEDIAFFQETGDCPTCHQPVSEERAEEHLAELTPRRCELEIQRESIGKLITASTKSIEDAEEAVTAAQSAHRAWERDDAVRRANLVSARREIEVLKQHLDRERAIDNPHILAREQATTSANRQLEALIRSRTSIEAEENPHTATRERVGRERITLTEKLAQQKRRETNLRNRLAQLEYWREGFKRVRLFCIKRVLRQLDIETMNAAQSLGLHGWRINYSTETETKSGTQKLGVQVEVQSPTMQGQFGSWSGGEGQRIRLCTALGFGGLIQRWLGVRWRLEVFDEPTQFLSGEGIDDLLELLRNRADSQDKAIYVADHRGLGEAGFARILTVVKGPEGSYVR